MRPPARQWTGSCAANTCAALKRAPTGVRAKSRSPTPAASCSTATKPPGAALAQVFGNLERDGVRRAARLLGRLTRAIVAHSGNAEEICLQCGIYLQNGCVVRDAARADCSYHMRTKTPRLRGTRP